MRALEFGDSLLCLQSAYRYEGCAAVAASCGVGLELGAALVVVSGGNGGCNNLEPDMKGAIIHSVTQLDHGALFYFKRQRIATYRLCLKHPVQDEDQRPASCVTTLAILYGVFCVMSENKQRLSFQETLFDTSKYRLPAAQLIPAPPSEPADQSPDMGPRENLTGHKFGMISVLRLTDEKDNGSYIYVCQCDCGQVVKLTSRHLRRKDSKVSHCGCQGAGRWLKPMPGARCIDKGVGKRNVKNNPKIAFNSLYARYRQGAQVRGLDFSLTKKQMHDLTQEPCHYCGALPGNEAKQGTHLFIYNGIDRKDNDRGYVIDNALPCCFFCNAQKSDKPYEDFLAWVRRVYEYKLKD